MEKKAWQEMPIGGLLPEGATAKQNETGSWRSFRPIWDPLKCNHCMFCVLYCPDMSIPIKNSEEGVQGKDGRVYKGLIRLETDLNYCKGCGICVEECPTEAIELIPESKEIGKGE